MDSAEGGWTLVATINDNDVTQKCTGNDLWVTDEETVAEIPYGNLKTQTIPVLLRGEILKPEVESLASRTSPKTHFQVVALALKAKFLALMALDSKAQVLENCPVPSLRTAVFFELLKFCRLPEKLFYYIARKKLYRLKN